MDLSLATVLQGATLAAVLWLFRSVQQLREEMVQTRTILTGASGNNGVSGEVKDLRYRTEAQERALARLDTHLREHVAQSVGTLDRRTT